ncbi:unnamed protein product [Trichogramma brassicae]|uniref:Reverse transcriptase domain-containing protein n=1 Tax=Trichogramma brassicae TaxID=86971 RepID=A0A6H5IT41_9HYME|nr:unnamed protein product [Trichogramma brassicae]
MTAMSAGLLDLQALSKSNEPLQNTPMSTWLRSSQPSSLATVVPPLSAAAITKRKQGRKVGQAGGPRPGPRRLRQGEEETCYPVAEILLLPHPGLRGSEEDHGVHRGTRLTGGRDGCLHSFLERETSDPQHRHRRSLLRRARATGPHPHEQVDDGNNNAVRSEETFTVVKGRRGRRRDAAQAEEVDRCSQPPRPRQRRVRLRPDAIVVKAAGTTTYADILRRLYAESAIQETVGIAVQSIRRSASGAMVLQLKKGVQNASALGTELDGVLGDAATASALSHKTAFEIRDLDECATREEICAALSHQLGVAKPDPDVVRSLRKAYAGTQTAVIDLPDELAAKAIRLGHLRVGRPPSQDLQKRTGVPALPRSGCQRSRHYQPQLSLGQEVSQQPTMRILQLNLNHCRSAQNLLCQTVRELGINVAIVCDQYKNPGPHYTWIADSNKQAAIWVLGGLRVQGRPSRPHPFFTARGRAMEDARRADFAIARGRLRAAIEDSKLRCWSALCDEVDRDVWGRPYGTVMARLRGPRATPPREPSLMRRTVAALFPTVTEALIRPPAGPVGAAVPGVTLDELRGACGRIRDGAAPGPDGVPNRALKLAVARRPGAFLQVYSACLSGGVFPSPWKRQRLVLLPKPGKPPDAPSSYRPLCMLDTAGKILERIVCRRLEVYTEAPDGLSDHQHGFRRGRSTVDAIESVTAAAREAFGGARGSRKYCAVVTLDVRNAFNSARWNNILAALERIRTPEYLQRIIHSYFQARVLEYDTDDGPESCSITAGVPQGSVLGPILWNAMYDIILRLRLDEGVRVVGFADDIAVIAVAGTTYEVEDLLSCAIARVRDALWGLGLETADHKTEALLISRKRRLETITIERKLTQSRQREKVRGTTGRKKKPKSDKNKDKTPGPTQKYSCWKCSWPGYTKKTCPECAGNENGESVVEVATTPGTDNRTSLIASDEQKARSASSSGVAKHCKRQSAARCENRC